MRAAHWACFVRLAVEGVGFAVAGFPLYVRAVVLGEILRAVLRFPFAACEGAYVL